MKISISQELIIRLAYRWLANGFGIWLSARLLASVSYNNQTDLIIFTALVLTVINAVLKPFITILSLPVILLTLGIFKVFVNGLMIFLVSEIVSGFSVDGFGSAILVGVIVGLVNYVVTELLEERLIESRK